MCLTNEQKNKLPPLFFVEKKTLEKKFDIVDFHVSVQKIILVSIKTYDKSEKKFCFHTKDVVSFFSTQNTHIRVGNGI